MKSVTNLSYYNNNYNTADLKLNHSSNRALCKCSMMMDGWIEG